MPEQKLNMRWEDPPTPNHSRTGHYPAWVAEAEALRENPKQWAVLKEYRRENRNRAAGFANAIRTGRYTAFRPEGAFEAREHTNELVSKVFARFVGGLNSEKNY